MVFLMKDTAINLAEFTREEHDGQAYGHAILDKTIIILAGLAAGHERCDEAKNGEDDIKHLAAREHRYDFHEVTEWLEKSMD